MESTASMVVLGRQEQAPLATDSDHLPTVVTTSKTLAIAIPKPIVTIHLNRSSIYHWFVLTLEA